MAAEVEFTPEILLNGGLNESRSPSQIRDNQWSACENVEALPDGFRTRRGVLKSNAIPLQNISESSEDGAADQSFTDGTSEYIMQSFQSAVALTVSHVAARVRITAGAPTGNIAAAIHAAGSWTALTGAGFGNFSEVVASTVVAGYRWYQWKLSTAVALAASTTYDLWFRHLGAAAGATFGLEKNAAGTYANGAAAYTNEANWGTSRTDLATEDLNFRVYGAPAVLTGIFDYRLSDGQTTRHVVCAGKEAYKNESGAMTLISGRDKTGPFEANADKRQSFAVGQDRLLITQGATPSKKYYVLSGTEYWENEGIAPPTAAPTVSQLAGGGTLAAGTYEVDYYYWNNDTSQPSNRKYQGLSAPSVTINLNDRIQISNLPADVDRAGDRATHIRIELKTPSSSVFRFAGTAEGQVPLGTTSTTITADATTTQAEYDHDVPVQHSIKQSAGNRQFIAGVPATPYRVYYSRIAGSVSLYESFPATNFRDFGRGEGDHVTALAFIPPRTLVVGGKDSIWAIDANQPGSSAATLVARGIGIAGHLAHRVIGRRLYFVSAADRRKGLFHWGGETEPVPMFEVDKTFKGLNQARLQYASCGHLAPGETRHQWWIALAASGSTVSDRVLVYDYALGAFSVYRMPSLSSVNVLGEIESSSGSTQLFIGDSSGTEQLADTGTQDNGTSYTGFVQGKAHDFGEPSNRKRLRFVDYTAGERSSGAIGIEVEKDLGDGQGVSGSLQHTGVTGSVWGSFNWGSGTWGGGADVVGRIALRTSAKYMRATFSGQDFHLKSISYGVQPTWRR